MQFPTPMHKTPPQNWAALFKICLWLLFLEEGPDEDKKFNTQHCRGIIGVLGKKSLSLSEYSYTGFKDSRIRGFSCTEKLPHILQNETEEDRAKNASLMSATEGWQWTGLRACWDTDLLTQSPSFGNVHPPNTQHRGAESTISPKAAFERHLPTSRKEQKYHQLYSSQTFSVKRIVLGLLTTCQHFSDAWGQLPK